GKGSAKAGAQKAPHACEDSPPQEIVFIRVAILAARFSGRAIYASRLVDAARVAARDRRHSGVRRGIYVDPSDYLRVTVTCCNFLDRASWDTLFKWKRFAPKVPDTNSAPSAMRTACRTSKRPRGTKRFTPGATCTL